MAMLKLKSDQDAQFKASTAVNEIVSKQTQNFDKAQALQAIAALQKAKK
jgi:hypothetical protein